jgi:hypothetical protein
MVLPHLASVLFESVAAKFTSAVLPARPGVTARRRHECSSGPPTVMGFVRHRMRALARSIAKGSPAVPGIRAPSKLGLPYDFTFWFGLFAPAGHPP